MKLKAIHRVFVYGIMLTLLIGYMVTKDANLWSAFTHSMTGVFGLEGGNFIANVEAKD